MTSSPLVRLPYTTVHYHLGELWLPHIISSWGKHPHHLHPFHLQGLPLQKNSHSFHTYAQTVSKTEKATSFARANGEHTYGWSHPYSHTGRTSQPQEVRDPSLVQVT